MILISNYFSGTYYIYSAFVYPKYIYQFRISIFASHYQISAFNSFQTQISDIQKPIFYHFTPNAYLTTPSYLKHHTQAFKHQQDLHHSWTLPPPHYKPPTQNTSPLQPPNSIMPSHLEFEAEFERVNFHLLGSHIYNNFGYIREYNIKEAYHIIISP